MLDWLMERFNITRPRAREIALQLLHNKYMVSICGTVEFNENSVTWYAAGYLEYLNAIDTVSGGGVEGTGEREQRGVGIEVLMYLLG